jgi:phosphoribosylformylglycinamidine (FGAM) synthase PurS component
MRPASRVTFIPTKANYSKIIKENEYLCENQEQPIIAVKVNQVLNWKLEGNSEESIDDALNNLIKKSISKTLIERDNYTIYLIDKLKC